MNTQERILKLKKGKPALYDYSGTYRTALSALRADQNLNDQEKNSREKLATDWITTALNFYNTYPEVKGNSSDELVYNIASQFLAGNFDPASVTTLYSGKDKNQIALLRIKEEAVAFYNYNRPLKKQVQVPVRGVHTYKWNDGISFDKRNGDSELERIATLAGQMALNLEKVDLNLRSLNTVYGNYDLDNLSKLNEIASLALNLSRSSEKVDKQTIDTLYNKLHDIVFKLDPSFDYKKYIEGNSTLSSGSAASLLKNWEGKGYKFGIDWSSLGEEYANYFSDGYKQLHVLATKGDGEDLQTFVFKKDLSGLADNRAYLNDDWRDLDNDGRPDVQGHGYMVHNGRLYTGDLTKYYNNVDGDYNDLQALLLTYTGKADGNGKYTDGSLRRADARYFYINSPYSPFMSTGNDFIDNNTHLFNGKKLINVGGYFDTDFNIIGTVDANTDIPSELISEFNQFKVDSPKITYHYQDNDGIHSATWALLPDTIKLQLNIKSNKASALFAISDIEGLESIPYLSGTEERIQTSNLFGSSHENTADLDVSPHTDTYNFFSPNINFTNPWSNETLDSDTSIEDVGRDKFARFLLYIYGDIDNIKRSTELGSKEKNNLIYIYDTYFNKEENKKWAISIIYHALKDGVLQKDPRYINAFQRLLKANTSLLQKLRDESLGKRREYEQAVDGTPSEKLGGILKAAQGAVTDFTGKPTSGSYSAAKSVREKAIQRAMEDGELQKAAERGGHTIKQERALQENTWTNQDILRAAALATDVIGLIGAITGAATGGIGSATAMLAGVASTAMDAGADFTDDKVSAGEAWRNLGINAGLSLGAAFGTKAPKILQKTMKILPRALMGIGAAGLALDEDVQKTADKVMSGKSLDVKDWQNVIVILRMATGLGNIGAQKAGQKKAIKDFDAKLAKATEKAGLSTETLKEIKAGSKSIKLTQSEFESIKADLESGKKADAINKLKAIERLGITTDADAEAFFAKESSRNWTIKRPIKSLLEKKTTYSLEGEDGKAALNPEDEANVYLRLLNDINADIDQSTGRIKGENWFTKTMGALDAGSEVIGKIPGIRLLDIKLLNYNMSALLNKSGRANIKSLQDWLDKNKDLIDNPDLLLAEFDAASYREGFDPSRLEAARQEFKTAATLVKTLLTEIENLNKQIATSKLLGTEVKEARDAVTKLEQEREKLVEALQKAANTFEDSKLKLVGRSKGFDLKYGELENAKRVKALADAALEAWGNDPAHYGAIDPLTKKIQGRWKNNPEAKKLQLDVDAAELALATAQKEYDLAFMKGGEKRYNELRGKVTDKETEISTHKSDTQKELYDLNNLTADLRKAALTKYVEEFKVKREQAELLLAEHEKNQPSGSTRTKAYKDWKAKKTLLEDAVATATLLEEEAKTLTTDKYHSQRKKDILKKSAKRIEELNKELETLTADLEAATKEPSKWKSNYENFRELRKQRKTAEKNLKELDTKITEAKTTEAEKRAAHLQSVSERISEYDLALKNAELETLKETMSNKQNALKLAVIAERDAVMKTLGLAFGKIGAETKVKVEGKVTTIPLDTKVTSYAHLRNGKNDQIVVDRILSAHPNAKKMDLDEAKKFAPVHLRDKIKGGFYSETDGIILYDNGGVLYKNKYSHLR